MRDLYKEVLSLVESEVEWLENAAQHYESLSGVLRDVEKSTWELLATVYRERARLHQTLAKKMRSQGQLSQTDISSAQPTDLLSRAD